MLIHSCCAQHFKRIAYEKNLDKPFTRAQIYEG